MTVEETKESLRTIDKMMLDSVNLIKEVKGRAESSVLDRYLNELIDDRSALLKRFDGMESKLGAEIADNEQVGGSVQTTLLEDSNVSDKALLNEILNGDKDLLDTMESEMVKSHDDEVKSLLDDASRELIRNTEVMKRMIDKNEV